MTNKTSEEKQQKIPIGEINAYLLINFIEEIETNEKTTEECHGRHVIDNDITEINITRIRLVILGKALDITNMIPIDQKEELKNAIE